jgi:hypothetical protein
MNIGSLMGIAGGLQPYTLQGQQDQQQIKLNALMIQQKTTELQQAKAEKDAMIKAFQDQQSATTNPVDSDGNINTSSLGVAIPKQFVKQIDTLYRQGNELLKIGSPKGYKYIKEAEDLTDKATMQQERMFKTQQEMRKQAIQNLNGITDQDSYNAAIMQSMQNGNNPSQIIPEFTGDFEKDKTAISHLRDTIQTVHEKDMEEERIKAREDEKVRNQETKRYHDETLTISNKRLAMQRENLDRLEKGGKSSKDSTALNQMKYISKANDAFKTYDSLWNKKNKALSKAQDDEDKEAQQRIVSDMNQLTASYNKQLDGLNALAKVAGVNITIKPANKTPTPTTTSSSKQSERIKEVEQIKYLNEATSQQDFNQRVQKLKAQGLTDKQIRDLVK